MGDTQYFEIANVGKKRAFISSTGVAENVYATILTGQNELKPGGQPQTFATPSFVWGELPGYFVYSSRAKPDTKDLFKVLTNHCPPVTRLNASQGSSYTVDMDGSPSGRYSVKFITEMSTVLHDILNTSKYDKPWEEDNFTGLNLVAYRYILSKIPGQVPPKYGTVKSGIINAIPFPTFPPEKNIFDRASFDYVKEYLGKQAAYFEYAEDWFSPDGLLTAVNLQVLIAGIDALTSTTKLMEIKDESILNMILDAVFGDIVAAVGAIPAVGPAIAAVLHIGMSTAKTIILAKGGSTSINATAAEMAQALTDTLQSMTDATAKQLADVTQNYGKLEAFAENVINGKISEKELGVGKVRVGGTSASSPKLPLGYITALGKGWEVAFFKQMYYIKFTPYVTLSFTKGTDLYAPPYYINPYWDPSKNKYKFVYRFLTTANQYTNYGKTPTPTTRGWLYCTGYTDGTPEVNHRLFDPDQLAVDPVSFFCGVDGWKYIIPYYPVGVLAYDQYHIVSIP